MAQTRTEHKDSNQIMPFALLLNSNKIQSLNVDYMSNQQQVIKVFATFMYQYSLEDNQINLDLRLVEHAPSFGLTTELSLTKLCSIFIMPKNEHIEWYYGAKKTPQPDFCRRISITMPALI